MDFYRSSLPAGHRPAGRFAGRLHRMWYGSDGRVRPETAIPLAGAAPLVLGSIATLAVTVAG